MKFICDDMLGKLARLLRALGFDTFYQKDIQDHQLLRKALEEERVVVTRDRKLVQVKTVPKYVLIWSDRPLAQLEELLQKLSVSLDRENVFSRCLECSTILKRVEKEKVKEKVYPYVYQTQENFWHCPTCDKIYWAGTHIQRMQEKLKKAGLL
ncbi:MAG: hypothetical protein A2142_02760 [candidate division Zixibacteria bacterium RBG_16_48_11]|nr:MAG: hypothetical protein A2142_02760 [candidate division Zixibacteria bacterium RBG_16_48_11]